MKKNYLFFYFLKICLDPVLTGPDLEFQSVGIPLEHALKSFPPPLTSDSQATVVKVASSAKGFGICRSDGPLGSFLVHIVPWAQGHRQELVSGVSTLHFCTPPPQTLAYPCTLRAHRLWSHWPSLGRGSPGPASSRHESAGDFRKRMKRTERAQLARRPEALSGHTDEPSRGARDHPRRSQRGNSAVTQASAGSRALIVHSTLPGHYCGSHSPG